MKKRSAWAPDLEGERGEVGLARPVDDAEGDPVDVDRRGGLQRPDHEGDQVGGHDHGGGEAHPALAAGLGGLLCDRAVGVGGEALVHHEGDLEGRLELGLVEAGEGPPGVGRLHLRGGDDVVRSGLVGEGGPVEAVQLVVEDPGEGEMQGGRPGGKGFGEGEGGPLLVGVEGDAGRGQGVPAVGVPGVELGEGDLELGGVEDDRGDRVLDGEVDLDVAGEGGRREVGSEHQAVGAGPDPGREAVGGVVRRAVVVGCRGAHGGQATVGWCPPTPPATPPARETTRDRPRPDSTW